MGKNKGVARAEAGTGEDAGSKYVRERVFQPNHRCSVQRVRLASEREQERDTRLQTRKTTQTNKYVGLERKTVTITGARCRKWLQPDQSRRWSTELSQEQGTRRRPREEGRSPRSGAHGRLTRAKGEAPSPSVLSLFPCVSSPLDGIPCDSQRPLLL